MLKLIGFSTALILFCGPVNFQTNQQPATAPPPEPEAKKVTMLAELTGTDSTNFKKEYLRCFDWQDWQQIWRRHREGKAPVKINQMFKFDLSKHMIIAVFAGDCGYPVWFHEIEEFKDYLRVRYTIDFPQTRLGREPRESVGPIIFEGGSYGFFVIPKSKKQIRIESGDKILIAEPYKWTEVAIIPAIQN